MTPSQAKLMRNEQRAAEDAVAAINPDDSDEAIAQIVAEYLLTAQRPPYRFSIFHDVRPRTQRGPCPLPFDWRHKNTVGITTRDREHARQWTIDAMLAGYGVFRGFPGHGGSGFGQGSIAHIRAGKRAAWSAGAHAGEAPKHL